MAALAGWYVAHPEPGYDRFHLPGFDAYVYVAMAERPAVFTVSPWGYRVLSPALAGALSPRNPVRGLRYLTFAALTAAGAVLYVFLRRRGHAKWAALLGVAALGLVPPVAHVARLPFFVDPLALLLLTAFLAALEARAGRGVLALLGVLLAFAKDPAVVLTLAPAVFAARWSEGGEGRGRAALLDALSAALPAAATEPLLRAWWTPQIPVVAAPLGPGLLVAAVGPFLDTWRATLAGLLVGGLAPLALLGALRRRARPALARYGVTLALLFAMALFAWVRVPSPVPVPLFGENVGRVLIYAVPLLVTLGLVALDRVAPNLAPPAPPIRPPRAVGGTAGLAALLALLAPLVLVDRYRRMDLQGSRDGPLVLTFCRETWRTATRLAEGAEVAFTPESHRFNWGETDVGKQGRMRWFLREGWGGLAHYGSGPIVMHAAEADLVLPVLRPRDLDVALRLSAPGVPVALAVNGRPLGRWRAEPDAAAHVFRVPASALLRGDNRLTVTAVEGGLGARLLEVTYRPAAP